MGYSLEGSNEPTDDRKTYTYGESNYSPIVVHEKTGDYKRGTTVARVISPTWDRGKTKFRNKETYVGDELYAMEYVKKIAEYYQMDRMEDWPELQRAWEALETNDVLSNEAAETVADALQEGNDPKEALEDHWEEKKEEVQNVEI